MSLEPNQPNDSNTVNDIANSSVDCNEKQMKFKSLVWHHFTYEDANGTKKVVFKYCRKEITYTTKNGTNGMHTHHKACKVRNRHMKIDDFQSCVIDIDDLDFDEDDEGIEGGYSNVNE
ncbi:unnamed protein product [Lactuca virosa]|uniref:BED-type domain-containing protein n=1 Tax=Lactuca virosa TaxID=75947 RepID=A0AAU9N308_9ASTR|nr:unnamed protein product [Lactuca virosa]